MVQKNGLHIDSAGVKRWYKDGKPHREDGPAVEFPDGGKYWYLNGRCHRENGPAIECFNGDKYWYKNGLLHRDDGPAVERADGHKEYWINGVKQSSPTILIPKLLTEKDVVFFLDVEPELMPVKGNVSAVNEEIDAKKEKWVEKELESGNVWAWCIITVTAKWDVFEGKDILAGCSYKNKENFMEDVYYEDMKQNALDDLNTSLYNMYKKLSKLIQ